MACFTPSVQKPVGGATPSSAFVDGPTTKKSSLTPVCNSATPVHVGPLAWGEGVCMFGSVCFSDNRCMSCTCVDSRAWCDRPIQWSGAGCSAHSCEIAGSLLASFSRVIIASHCLTEMYPWSVRPLMSQFCSGTVCSPPPVHTCNSPCLLGGRAHLHFQSYELRS